MLIKLFSKAYVTQYSALFILQLLLWIPVFIFPDYSNQISNPDIGHGYKFIESMFGSFPRLSSFIAFILVYISALLLNNTLVNHQLISKNSLLAAFIYILLMSRNAALLTLYPALISNVFIIFILNLTFSLYMEKEAYSKTFNIGILLAFASVFYFNSVFILVFLWLTFNVYRIYTWREWLLPIIGLLTIYLFLGVYFFWMDDLINASEIYLVHFQDLYSFEFEIYGDIFTGFITGIIILFTILTFGLLLGRINEYIISVRKHYWSVILLLIITSAILIFLGGVNELEATLLVVPSTAIIANYLVHLKRAFRTDIFLWLLIFIVLMNNYYAVFSYHFIK